MATQGIVSVRVDGVMQYKIVVGCDGMRAQALSSEILFRHQQTGNIPTLGELIEMCVDHKFGCWSCRTILKHNPTDWNHPTLHGPELGEGPDAERYFDTFHVAEFNPRWKYGTADHVEVVNL